MSYFVAIDDDSLVWGVGKTASAALMAAKKEADFQEGGLTAYGCTKRLYDAVLDGWSEYAYDNEEGVMDLHPDRC